VARSLEEIVTRTRRVDVLIGDIASASDQQRRGLEQVGRAMSDIEKVTQMGAASAQETSATVIQLNSQAESLRDVVQALERLSGAAVA
jgi:methyl-accepting chemotaxis protein